MSRTKLYLRVLLFWVVFAVPISALCAYMWGLMGTAQQRYLDGSYFVSWAAWFGLISGCGLLYIVLERLIGPPFSVKGDGD